MSDYFSLLHPAAPVDDTEVRRLARHGCLDIHRVEWLRCYLSSDGERKLCHYQAADAESVRFVLRHQGFVDSTVFPAEFTPYAEAAPAQNSRTVVEFHFSPQDVDQLQSTANTLLASNALPLLASMESTGGSALILILEATTADTVREQLHALGIEATDIWQCTEMDPRPSALFEDVADIPNPALATAPATSTAPAPDVDAIIIGAGVSGICALQRLTVMGLNARAFESASDVGGVWYWNRYPGARVDSETYSYAFSFSDELVKEWDWSELFCAQPEIEQYLKHVVDRFDLRRHITFNAVVSSAKYDMCSARWNITTEAGDRVSARYLIVASGTLSTPQLPDYPGMHTFAGPSSHTALWPADDILLAGKRVGVIGTGASGVQVIQTIAGEVKQLTVFQRTPTFSIPQRNRLLSDADRRKLRNDWPGILAGCRGSYGGFIHDFDARSGLAVSPQEREALFESWWQKPGFAFWIGNFADLMMNDEVNTYACEFLRRKIRERVRDPRIADQLIPDHPFGSKRVPLENGYYEAYNRDNVELVNLRDSPIQAVTPEGIRTSNGDYPLDVIIYATGFDVGTGAFDRMDIRGERGVQLKEKWKQGPRTFLGLMVSDFPNLFITNGPQNPSGLCNATRCIEQNIDWIAGAVEYLQKNGLTRIVPTADAEQCWIDHVEDAAAGTVLARNTNSWFYGANTPGKPQRVNVYAPGARHFREHCEEIERSDYLGCVLS